MSTAPFASDLCRTCSFWLAWALRHTHRPTLPAGLCDGEADTDGTCAGAAGGGAFGVCDALSRLAEVCDGEADPDPPCHFRPVVGGEPPRRPANVQRVTIPRREM